MESFEVDSKRIYKDWISTLVRLTYEELVSLIAPRFDIVDERFVKTDIAVYGLNRRLYSSPPPQ
ncbi:MAG TPA: hypothetical protein VFI73_10660 [Candidatus Nitrosopolaris sp.]|nr:hypothetical protein [Candidatus Nitrosopolaris sp.]